MKILIADWDSFGDKDIEEVLLAEGSVRYTICLSG